MTEPRSKNTRRAFLGHVPSGDWNLRLDPFATGVPALVVAFGKHGVTVFWVRGRGRRWNWTWST